MVRSSARRWSLACGMSGIGVVLALAGCGSAQPDPAQPDGPESGPGVTEPAPGFSMGALDGVALPDGWRYESFGGAEVGVPDTWGYGVSGAPWCTRSKDDQPYVGRPGAVVAIGCASGAGGADPATELATGGTFVWFDRTQPGAEPATGAAEPAPGAAPEAASDPDQPVSSDDSVSSSSGGSSISGATGGGSSGNPGSGVAPAQPGPSSTGDRITLTVDDVRIVIQAEAKLRDQIAATVRSTTGTNGLDSNLCPSAHEISTTPSHRPDGRQARAKTLGQHPASRISVCKYALDQPMASAAKDALIASRTLTGRDAAAAAEAIYAARSGGGPNEPASCAKDHRYGDEAIVLTVQAGSSAWPVVLRYSGCDAHGFDDGTTVRALTKDNLARILTGATEVRSYNGELSGLVPLPKAN